MDQSANKLALVEPSNFNFNIQTFDTNVFQNDVQFNKQKILEEFNNSNTGLVVIDGKLIEKPVLREMQRKILIADKINKN